MSEPPDIIKLCFVPFVIPKTVEFLSQGLQKKDLLFEEEESAKILIVLKDLPHMKG